MLGRRSLRSEIQPFDPEIQRTFRVNRRKNMKRNQENDPPRQLKEYFTPSIYMYSPCIQVPPVEATQYKIKSSIIQMLPSFYELNNEDPYKHLEEFLEICSTVKIHNFSDDALRLKLFSFSLKDKTKYWLHTLDSMTIST